MIGMIFDDIKQDIKNKPYKLFIYLFVLFIIIYLIIIGIKIIKNRYKYTDVYDGKIHAIYVQRPDYFKFDENNQAVVSIIDLINDKSLNKITALGITHDDNWDLCLGNLILTKIDEQNIKVDTSHICDKVEAKVTKNDDRNLYLISKSRSIYSDMKDPKMILNDKVVSVSEIDQTNCTVSCIHNYSEPIATLYDGGSKIYEYEVENEKYYVIMCNKMDSKYHNGKDVIISKDMNKLANLC